MGTVVGLLLILLVLGGIAWVAWDIWTERLGKKTDRGDSSGKHGDNEPPPENPDLS